MRKIIASFMTLLILATGILAIAPANNVHATTATENFVNRLYQTCFGRNGDRSGLDYWTNRLDNKTATGASVAANFIFSQEFINMNCDDNQFMDTMYHAFFDRNPDAGGKNYYLNLINNNGWTRARVFQSFVNSKEFANVCRDYNILRGEYIIGEDPNRVAQINGFVDRLYRVILGRGSDQEGLSYWTNWLMNGSATGASAAANFFFSQEYKNKNKSNAEFIEDLYQALMGRSSDAGGRNYYNQKMENGASRAYVFNCFVVSQEFSDICSSFGINRGEGIAVTDNSSSSGSSSSKTDTPYVDASGVSHSVSEYQVDGYGTVYGYFVDTTEFNSLLSGHRSSIGRDTSFSSSSYIRTRAIECTIVFGHTRPNGEQWHQSSESAYLSEILTQRVNNRDAYDSFINSSTHKHIMEYSYSDFTTAAFVRLEWSNGGWHVAAEATVAQSRP